jgi:hypothetical protein
MSKKPDPRKADPRSELNQKTTGHSWDGIEEWDNPMPRWWLWTFYATIVWALIYVILFPAWPLITGATPGLLGFSTRANVAADIQRFDEANAPIRGRLVEADLETITQDPELLSFANNAGAAVFLRTDPEARRMLAGRGGRLVQVQTTAEGFLEQLVARWPSDVPEQARSHFIRMTLQRAADGRCARREAMSAAAAGAVFI